MSGPAKIKFKTIRCLSEKSHCISLSCKLLQVSTSGYYKYCRQPVGKRKLEDKEYGVKICHIFFQNKGRYGAPRIKVVLRRQGVKTSCRRIGRLMRENNLRCVGKRAFKPKTTINNPLSRKSPRVFKIEESSVIKTDQVWASDLTYIPAKSKFLYLVVVMDIFSREIISWRLSSTMKASETNTALMDAVKSTPGTLAKTIFHSDQGSQYCASELRENLKLLGIKQSMSRKGNCYDNAYVESFFHTLKNELDLTSDEEINEMNRKISEYIKWYNKDRLHSALGYHSPKEFKLMSKVA